MAGKVYAYIRVSTNDQTFDEQYQELDNYIRGNVAKSFTVYKDLLSSRDSDWPKFEELKEIIESGDTVVVKDLDKLGTSYEEIKRALTYFRKLGVKVKIIGLPILNTNDEPIAASLNNLMIELLGYIIEREKQKIQNRSKKGLETSKAKGIKLGRPERTLPRNFQKYYRQWEANEITAVEFSRIMGVSRATLYRYIDKYKQNL